VDAQARESLIVCLIIWVYVIKADNACFAELQLLNHRLTLNVEAAQGC